MYYIRYMTVYILHSYICMTRADLYYTWQKLFWTQFHCGNMSSIPPTGNSWTPAGCPRISIQFNSDSIYLKITSGSTG